MSNDIRKIEHAVQLPYDVVPTASTSEDWSPKDSVVIDQHPYRTAFMNGVSEGFKLPFAALFGVFGLVGCDSGSRLAHYPNEEVANADGGNHADGSNEVSISEDADVASSDDSADVSEDGPDQTDAGLDAVLDAETDVAEEVAQDIAQDATVTQDVAEDVELDAAQDVTNTDADAAVDTSADASETQEVAEDVLVTPDTLDAAEDVIADAVSLPEDTSSDANIAETEDAQDAVIQDATADVENDTGVICQYQWQCPDTSDASLPEDATMSVADTGASAPVYSKLCGGIGGALSMAAPVNSAIVACTNNTINALMSGGNSCVAECAFFDSIGITLSANPQDIDPLAPTFFDQNWNPKPEVVLTLKAPIMSDGSTPAFPDAMEKSYKFTYNFSQSFASGTNVWNAKDKDANGNPMVGKITLEYQWGNIITKNPGALDITFEGPAISGKAQYHYPCNTLVDEQGVLNAIIQCTEVK